MENYFNYFTDIEEHFQKRRGTILLLNTLDWALIETWKEAGVPLEAAIRGIDEAFDKWDSRPSKTRKVNSLAYCAQEVLAAAEEMKAAAGGAAPVRELTSKESGFESEKVAAFLRRNADLVEKTSFSQAKALSSDLRGIAAEVAENKNARLEELERRLTVMEEKLVAGMMASAKDEELVALRAEADRELAPYRSKMPAAQIDHLLRQFMQKRMLEKAGVPRLSLFYM